MKMCEALSFIDELLDSGWYSKPTKYDGKRRRATSSMVAQSYRRTALVELHTFLASCPDHEPIFLLEKYREAMEEKSCSGKTETSRFVFTTMYEVATEVLDMLLVR